MAATVGFVASVGTIYWLWFWFKGRRAERERDAIVDKLVRENLDEAAAADLRETVTSLQALERQLRETVTIEVPLEARRVYLRDRVDALTKSVGREYSDLIDTEAALAALGEEAISDLGVDIRVSLEQSILPRYVLEQRRSVRDRIFWAVAFVLLIAPGQLSPSYWFSVYVDGVANASSPEVLAQAAVFGGFWFGLVAALVLALFRGVRSPGRWPQAWRIGARVVVESGLMVYSLLVALTFAGGASSGDWTRSTSAVAAVAMALLGAASHKAMSTFIPLKQSLDLQSVSLPAWAVETGLLVFLGVAGVLGVALYEGIQDPWWYAPEPLASGLTIASTVLLATGVARVVLRSTLRLRGRTLGRRADYHAVGLPGLTAQSSESSQPSTR